MKRHCGLVGFIDAGAATAATSAVAVARSELTEGASSMEGGLTCEDIDQRKCQVRGRREEGVVKRRYLLVSALGAVVVALAAGNASARSTTNEFAVGSAKTDIDLVVVDEHASFSAHNTGVGCAATGQIVYDQPTLAFTAKIDVLVVMGPAAYFGGPITKVQRGPVAVGESAYFDALDSQQPGGVGDEFTLETLLPSSNPACLPPIAGFPITRGNVVIKGDGLP
jgi:hypothetical protein